MSEFQPFLSLDQKDAFFAKRWAEKYPLLDWLGWKKVMEPLEDFVYSRRCGPSRDDFRKTEHHKTNPIVLLDGSTVANEEEWAAYFAFDVLVHDLLRKIIADKHIKRENRDCPFTMDGLREKSTRSKVCNVIMLTDILLPLLKERSGQDIGLVLDQITVFEWCKNPGIAEFIFENNSGDWQRVRSLKVKIDQYELPIFLHDHEMLLDNKRCSLFDGFLIVREKREERQVYFEYTDGQKHFETLGKNDVYSVDNGLFSFVVVRDLFDYMLYLGMWYRLIIKDDSIVRLITWIDRCKDDN